METPLGVLRDILHREHPDFDLELDSTCSPAPVPSFSIITTERKVLRDQMAFFAQLPLSYRLRIFTAPPTRRDWLAFFQRHLPDRTWVGAPRGLPCIRHGAQLYFPDHCLWANVATGEIRARETVSLYFVATVLSAAIPRVEWVEAPDHSEEWSSLPCEPESWPLRERAAPHFTGDDLLRRHFEHYQVWCATQPDARRPTGELLASLLGYLRETPLGQAYGVRDWRVVKLTPSLERELKRQPQRTLPEHHPFMATLSNTLQPTPGVWVGPLFALDARLRVLVHARDMQDPVHDRPVSVDDRQLKAFAQTLFTRTTRTTLTFAGRNCLRHEGRELVALTASRKRRRE